MKKLTQNQLTAIQSLEENPLIAEVQIKFGKGLSRVTITSIVGTSWNEVDAVINEVLDGEFPGLEYMGRPVQYVNPFDAINQELYFINFRGETLFNLIMRIAPEQEGGGS